MSRTIRRMPLAILTVILTVLLLFSCLLGLKLGYLSVSLSGIVSILASHLVGSALPSDIAMGAADAVWDLRLPRILLALAVRMGLSLSGMVMQAMFRTDVGPLHHGCVLRGIAGGGFCRFLWRGGGFRGICDRMRGISRCLGIVIHSRHRGRPRGTGNSSYLLIFGAALAAVCGGSRVCWCISAPMRRGWM